MTTLSETAPGARPAFEYAHIQGAVAVFSAFNPADITAAPNHEELTLNRLRTRARDLAGMANYGEAQFQIVMQESVSDASLLVYDGKHYTGTVFESSVEGSYIVVDQRRTRDRFHAVQYRHAGEGHYGTYGRLLTRRGETEADASPVAARYLQMQAAAEQYRNEHGLFRGSRIGRMLRRGSRAQ